MLVLPKDRIGPGRRSVDAVFEVRDIPKLTAKQVEAILPGVITVARWTEADVAAGLLGLAGRAEGVLADFPGDDVRLTFKFGRAFLDEFAFWKKVAAEKLDVTDAARGALEAWMAVLAGSGRAVSLDDTRFTPPVPLVAQEADALRQALLPW